MYNLNVNVNAAGAAGLLGVEGSCTTPKTPEILNSLIAMTNPFDGYAGNGGAGSRGPRIASVPPGHSSMGDNSSSSSSGQSSCRSPLASPTGGTPSVQHTCSQLIKEGLKLTIQTKRRATGSLLDDPLAYDRGPKMTRREGCEEEVGVALDDYADLLSPGLGLTPEDEERRRRRRERNKIAATKCRLKKRERTVNLVQESEILETQNHDLKSQIQELETQRRRLMDMLSMHNPNCIKNGASGRNVGNDGYNGGGGDPAQTYETFGGSYHGHQQHYGQSCNFGGSYVSSSGVDGGCMA